MNQHFKIIITCCDGQKWISRSILSLIQQDYKNWEAIVIDAQSVDETYKMLSYLVVDTDKITLVRNGRRKEALFNDIVGIKMLDPHDEDVIVFLDGDDWLFDSQALSILNDAYSDPNVWITWGSYIAFPPGLSKARSVPTPKDFDMRTGEYIYSHLKTCKHFLWKNIKDEDLRVEETGEYYPTTQDLAFMFPMMEMAGEEHRKFIDKILYVYNTSNIASGTYAYPKLRVQYNGEIRRKTPYYKQIKENLLNGCRVEPQLKESK